MNLRVHRAGSSLMHASVHPLILTFTSNPDESACGSYMFESNALSVRGFSVSSSKKRGVKRASPVAPIKLGLKMSVLPRRTLIQAWLTEFQVRVRTSPKKLPKMAKNGLFWPFLALNPI